MKYGYAYVYDNLYIYVYIYECIYIYGVWGGMYKDATEDVELWCPRVM